MTIYTDELLDKKVESGEAGLCISVNGARIIIPTACEEVVGFTNPDDLSPDLRERWKKGERGEEFENQKLVPGDCLILYDNGRDINRLFEEYPDWHKTAEGIKNMIEKLYGYAEIGANGTAPAIWNSHLKWAKDVKLTTSAGELITDEVWKREAGRAISAIKSPDKQYFVHIKPGDKLITPIVMPDGSKQYREQTSGSMSAVAVKQPDGGWNIVQLNAKGYTVVEDRVAPKKISKSVEARDGEDWLQKKLDAITKRLGERAGKTGNSQTGEVSAEDRKVAATQMKISRGIMERARG
jgi:hypothetical protein